MNIKIVISFLMVLMFGASSWSATLTGIVTDETTKEPLAGAQVYLEQLQIGATTDTDGYFTIENVPVGQHVLVVEMLGYRQYRTPVTLDDPAASEQLTIALQPTIYNGAEVIVEASKMGQAVEDIPAATYVVGLNVLRQTDSRNIEELAQVIPGIFTEDRFHTGYNNVSFRGVGLHSHVTRGILVLVDGIPVNEAMGRVDFEQINYDNLERVEVIKGPVSALYGPNGVTGVINMVTRTPSTDPSGSIRLTVGSYNTRNISGRFTGKWQQYGYNFHYNYYSSDGYRERNAYFNRNVGAKFRADYQRLGSFIFSTEYSNVNTDYPGTLTLEQFNNRVTEATRLYTGSHKEFVTAGLVHRKFWSVTTSLETSIYGRKLLDDYAYVDRFSIDKQLLNGGFETRFQSQFQLLGTHEYIIGGSYLHENNRIKYYNLDDAGNRTTLMSNGENRYDFSGIFVQDDYAITPDFHITAGVRYDILKYDWRDYYLENGNSSNTTTITYLSPKLAVRYKFHRSLVAYANYGNGFNPPQTRELYEGTYSTHPNPELEPEYLENYEVGIKGSLGRSMAYQIAAYYMEFKNQIVVDEYTNQYVNAGLTSHKGVEAQWTLQDFYHFTTTLSYSYLQAKFDDFPGYTGKTLRRTPEHQVGFRIVHEPFASFNWVLSGKYMSGYYMDNLNEFWYDGHTVLDLQFNYTYRQIDVSLKINNLLDATYATYASAYYSSRTRSWSQSYYAGWPRNITLSLSWNF